MIDPNYYRDEDGILHKRHRTSRVVDTVPDFDHLSRAEIKEWIDKWRLCTLYGVSHELFPDRPYLALTATRLLLKIARKLYAKNPCIETLYAKLPPFAQWRKRGITPEMLSAAVLPGAELKQNRRRRMPPQRT